MVGAKSSSASWKGGILLQQCVSVTELSLAFRPSVAKLQLLESAAYRSRASREHVEPLNARRTLRFAQEMVKIGATRTGDSQLKG